MQLLRLAADGIPPADGEVLNAIIQAQFNLQKKLQAKTQERLLARTQRNEVLLGRPDDKRLLSIVSDVATPLKKRLAACDVIAGRKLRRAVPALLRVFEDGPDLMTWAVAHALVTMRARTAVDSLIEIARSATRREAKRAAVYTLWFLGDPRAKEVLREILRNEAVRDDHLRALAVEALAAVDSSPEGLALIIAASADRSVEVRYAAVCALSLQESKAAVSAVKARVNDRGVLPERGTVGAFARSILATYRQKTGRRQRTER